MHVIEISANNNLSYYINVSEIEAVEVSESTEKKSEKDDQPRDYSEGSSGILKADR